MVTYDRARSDSMLQAYDALVLVEGSARVDEVSSALFRRGGSAHGLSYLMINVDDGSCYEVICRAFEVRGAEATTSP